MELFLHEYQFIRPPCTSVLVDWQTHGKNKTQGCQVPFQVPSCHLQTKS